MSLVFSSNITCGNCGHTFEIGEYVSTNSFGEVDLDTRPAPDYRYTMNEILVTCCPGYRFPGKGYRTSVLMSASTPPPLQVD